ncbi:thiolase family protein [PVC group bacterium]|nr:thiolase family protein [PVC group bacterium]
MDRIAIVDGVRTPFVKVYTDFNDLEAYDLGRIVAIELIQKTEFDKNLIDEVIFGCVANSSDAANMARVVLLLAGIPERKRAMTVSRNCASGIESVTSGAEKIMTGAAQVVLAGGAESMSNIPLYYQKHVQNIFVALGRSKTLWTRLSQFFRLNPRLLLSPRVGLELGLTDPVCGVNMGITAENIAKDFGISRKEQDAFSLMSHQRAAAGLERLKEEMVPVYVKDEYNTVIDRDNGVRENQTMDALAKLRPYFDRKSGSVTAGNSSQITDGASVILMMKEKQAKSLGYTPLGYLRAYAYEGLDPSRMGLGPAYAIPTALDKAGCSLKDIQLIEINEAFAAQVIACVRALESKTFCSEKLGRREAVGEINREILNVNGGSIALGHPVGSTGNRLILTLLKEMKRRGLGLGMVSLCVGGGQGAAVILERE